jgi:hypothetical protein
MYFNINRSPLVYYKVMHCANAREHRRKPFTVTRYHHFMTTSGQTGKGEELRDMRDGWLCERGIGRVGVVSWSAPPMLKPRDERHSGDGIGDGMAEDARVGEGSGVTDAGTTKNAIGGSRTTHASGAKAGGTQARGSCTRVLLLLMLLLFLMLSPLLLLLLLLLLLIVLLVLNLSLGIGK